MKPNKAKNFLLALLMVLSSLTTMNTAQADSQVIYFPVRLALELSMPMERYFTNRNDTAEQGVTDEIRLILLQALTERCNVAIGADKIRLTESYVEMVNVAEGVTDRIYTINFELNYAGTGEVEPLSISIFDYDLSNPEIETRYVRIESNGVCE
jgi:hypothetical protein